MKMQGRNGMWILSAALVALGLVAGPLAAEDGKTDGAKPCGEQVPAKTPAKPAKPVSAARAKALQDLSTVLKSMKISMGDATRAAEKRTGGRAFNVELEREDGRVVYEIKTLVMGQTPRLMEVKVDTATGQILEVEDETSGDDDGADEHDDDDDDKGAADDDDDDDDDDGDDDDDDDDDDK